eukprot:SAG31_NODE_13598_length_858_cov_1.424242_1_plen_80_part_00
MSVLGRATIQPYNATKYAINGLTRGLACELGPYNIQVCKIEVEDVGFYLQNRGQEGSFYGYYLLPIELIVSTFVPHHLV